jgi:hypothetical protein
MQNGKNKSKYRVRIAGEGKISFTAGGRGFGFSERWIDLWHSTYLVEAAAI